ncbi:cytochrome c oxidase subunit II [Gimesia algae]|uniref:Cytochrome aa3 subunit 2 n=1 Tax=Gimesia algae TaxID=2527971 RepID=A0A517VHQ0_9PLAN|nr:cytochrome c oxidase subunit II [Gimesia algae]QDT92541.1 Cytochrome c oxidase subunit 2 precursor [Gimesia algae]
MKVIEMPAEGDAVKAKLICAGVLISGCSSSQSALNPAGAGAEQIARLFWWMAGGATIIWLVMVALSIYALHLNPVAHHRQKSALFIIGGGAIAPTIILTILLIYGLNLLPALLARPPAGTLQIEVEGYQWWWKVSYPAQSGKPVELANEIRLPRGEPVEFILTSKDVVHSFWIPSLGGKVDMIPGRTTRLTLHPTKTGHFRGACAEYCGASHAYMNFTVDVVEKEEFDEWLAQQSTGRITPQSASVERGEALFLQTGCGACHTIRGTEADGKIGPDLTHIGSRNSLGADMFPNNRENLQKWIAHVSALKPGVKMPAFRALKDDEYQTLSKYLEQLK